MPRRSLTIGSAQNVIHDNRPGVARDLARGLLLQMKSICQSLNRLLAGQDITLECLGQILNHIIPRVTHDPYLIIRYDLNPLVKISASDFSQDAVHVP